MDLLTQPGAAKWFRGILHLEETDEGFHPQRFTKTQLEHFKSTDGYRIRSRCMAGVSIAIETDAKALRVAGPIITGARAHFGMELEVDEVVTHAVRKEQHSGSFDLTFDLPDDGKLHQLVLYLPHSLELRFTTLELQGADTARPPHHARRRLLCIGDSITQGMNAVMPLSTVAVQLARLLDFELLNQGVGGHVFDANAVDPDLPFAPDLVTVAYGVNDWRRGLTQDQVAANAAAMLEKLRSSLGRCQIAVITPLWETEAELLREGGTLAEFSAAIEKRAMKVAPICINGYALIPNQPWYFVDGVHPNELGFMHYATNLHRCFQDTELIRG